MSSRRYLENKIICHSEGATYAPSVCRERSMNLLVASEKIKYPHTDQIFRILNPAQGGIQKTGLHFVPTKTVGTSFRMTMI